MLTRLSNKKCTVNEKAIKEWYDKKYALRNVTAMGKFDTYPIFLNYLNVQEGKKLLDVGCGTGILLKCAYELGLETYGVDVSNEALKIARHVSPNSSFFLGKAENLRFKDDNFDYITCIGSLEHFLDIKKALKEMVRVAKKDAFFCIMVPNKNFIFRKIRSGWFYNKEHINIRLLDFKQWRKILENGGLKIIKIYFDRWFEIGFPKNPTIIKRIKKNLFKIFWIFLPLKYTHHFIFLCKKCKK